MGAEEHLDPAATKPLDAFRQRGMLALRGVQVRQDDNRQLHADRLAEEPERERVGDAGRPLVDRVQGGWGDDDSGAVEVDRTINASGLVSLAGRQLLAAEILAGRRVTIRLDSPALQVLDPDSRELLRTRPNPLSPAQTARLRGARPGGPPPRPSRAPVRIQRRVASNGVIMVTGQRIPLGRTHAGQVVTIHASDAALTIDLGDGTTTIRRTTTHPVRGIKAHRPRKAGYVS
jgi:hypothetical protein